MVNGGGEARFLYVSESYVHRYCLASLQQMKAEGHRPIFLARTPSLFPKTIDPKSLAIAAQPPHAERARIPIVHLTSNGTRWRSSRPMEARLRSTSHAS